MNKFTAISLVVTYGPGTLKEIGTKAGLDSQGIISNLVGAMASYSDPWVTRKNNKKRAIYTATKTGIKVVEDNPQRIYTIEQINAGEVVSRPAAGKQLDLVEATLSPSAQSAVGNIVKLVEENKRLRGVIASFKAQSTAALEG